MKSKFQIKGTSPYSESGDDMVLTMMSDLYRFSLIALLISLGILVILYNVAGVV